MVVIHQITPLDIYHNKDTLESYLSEKLSPLVSEQTWMKDWKHIAQRFQLFKVADFLKEEIDTYQWDVERVKAIILDTVHEVQKHLPYDDITVTVFPALPFRWFQKFDQSIWTNGFTNGPNTIQIAIPPVPDEQFLRYMVAHELHHATPINPIYQLTLDTFSLSEWYKMEGGAEYFSLSLYADKRWWKDDFTSDTESFYWEKAKDNIHTTDDREKGPLCFGDPENGLPYMVGYAFAYQLFKNYVKQQPTKNVRDLLLVEPTQFLEEYQNKIAK